MYTTNSTISKGESTAVFMRWELLTYESTYITETDETFRILFTDYCTKLLI